LLDTNPRPHCGGISPIGFNLAENVMGGMLDTQKQVPGFEQGFPGGRVKIEGFPIQQKNPVGHGINPLTGFDGYMANGI
jgi:hypothetical protein